MKISPQNDDLNLAKVAKLLRISRSLVLKLVKAGEFPSRRSQSGIRVSSDDLRVWVDSRIADLAKMRLNK